MWRVKSFYEVEIKFVCRLNNTTSLQVCFLFFFKPAFLYADASKKPLCVHDTLSKCILDILVQAISHGKSKTTFSFVFQ